MSSPAVLIVRLFPGFYLHLLNAILQVGAGPTGLTLALALLKNGVSVRIIDKLKEPRIGQKGTGIMVWHLFPYFRHSRS